ncbi:MAG: amino acid ABC transporter substrate-binding protein [Burkholderiaceae bacterium]|jgi:polar amino acid transport system substrate-binding protein|nr:amino acid ABC transporter substrate-binding protein [Burkholderiaceae bacterium]
MKLRFSRFFPLWAWLFAGLLLIAGGVPGSAFAASAATPLTGRTIVVGLDDNFPPMGFRDEKGNIVGFDIDMAREAFKRLGAASVQFKPIDWDAKEAELNSKRVDVLWNGLTITDERKKQIAFTAPYMQNHQIIVVAAKSPIANKAALTGKVVGAQTGSSAIDAIEKDAAVRKSFRSLKTYGDNVAALMDLNAGRLDAVVLDEVVGRYYTAKKPGQYRVLQDNFGTESYGVGLRKSDAALLAELQKALDGMKRDGASERISKKWFGANVIQ